MAKNRVFRYVAWEERVFRVYKTVEATDKKQAMALIEEDKGKFEREELVEKTDGGLLIEEYGVCELEPKTASTKPILGWASSFSTYCPHCVSHACGTAEGGEEYFDRGELMEAFYDMKEPTKCERCGIVIDYPEKQSEPNIETADPTRLKFMRENGIGQCAKCSKGLSRWNYLTKLADKSKTGEESIYCEKCINKAVRSK